MKTNLRTQKGLNIMMLGGIHKYCKDKSTWQWGQSIINFHLYLFKFKRHFFKIYYLNNLKQIEKSIPRFKYICHCLERWEITKSCMQISSFKLNLWNMEWRQYFVDLPYARHYTPRFVYFLPTFWRPFLCFQGGFF